MDSTTAFNAEIFRSQTGKPASPSQYLVTLGKTPNIMGSRYSELPLAMTAQTAEIPARQLDVVERRYNGPIRSVPTGHTYSTLNIEYFETSDYNIRNYFNTWQNEIFKETEAWKVPFYRDIIAPWIDIELFGPDGRRMSAYRIYEVFPVTISSTQLGWGLTNQSMNTNIEFAYHRWEELSFKKTEKKGQPDIEEVTGILGVIKNAANKFGTFVKTVKTIKRNVDFSNKTVKNAQNIEKELRSLKIDTKTLGGFVSSLDDIGNLGSSINRRINNFGSGKQRVSTSKEKLFNDFK
jgi:hypothetical protein